MSSNNTSHLPLECEPLSHDTHMAFSCLYFLLFPVALVLNGVAAWVSLRLLSTSTFMVYLKNLVASDLVLTLTFPLMAASGLPGAAVELKMFTCRYSTVVFYCCLYTSVTLMGLISLDRFFKIVRPCGRSLGQNMVFSQVMCALVWVILLGCTGIPTMILTNQYPGDDMGDFCMSMKSPAGVRLHTGVVLFMEILFWGVSAVVVVCYICITSKVLQSFRNSGSSNSQGKQQTKLRVFLVLFVFLVCFVPFHIVRVPLTLQEAQGEDCTHVWFEMTAMVTKLICTTSVCLDPLLYFFLCREFRDKLVGMVTGRGACPSLNRMADSLQ